jgi:hypothetical protein
MDSSLKLSFDQAMYGIYRKAKKEVKYDAHRYFNMLEKHGGLETAHILVNSPAESEGYTTLWELGRLDLTVEALIFDNTEYQTLFTKEELLKIKKRLQNYGYNPVVL